MRLPFRSRLIAVAWALLAAVAVPGLAVAHGTAHHDLATGAEHEHSPAHGVTAVDEHDSGDHAHPEISPISSGRLVLPAFAAAKADDVHVAIVLTGADAPSFVVAAAAGTPPPDSPRQPRAPPLG